MLQALVTNSFKKLRPLYKMVIMDAKKERILKQFGENIRDFRKKKGLSQDEVVLNSDHITKGTISDIENGKRNLSFTTLIDLAKGLEVHPKELFNFDFEKYKTAK